MQKIEKLSTLIREPSEKPKNTGPRYLPTLATNIRGEVKVKKPNTRGKLSSLSNKNSKLRRYPGLEDSHAKILENKSKLNFSLKNYSINKTGRSVFSIYAGIPYLKELRYARKQDSSLYTSPKKFHSDTINVSRNVKSFNGTLYDKEESVKIKIRKIDHEIKFLESKLEEFMISCQLAGALIGYIDDVDEITIKNVVKIQKWFRKKLEVPKK
jgi:hypothetical protein